MQVELVIPGTESDILYHPIQYGLLENVNKVPGYDKGQFGCRHCGQNSKPKYNGMDSLISHLKDKYGTTFI